jgi:NTP pyrophosphatase (non-canonical NTP hydrolase)
VNALDDRTFTDASRKTMKLNEYAEFTRTTAIYPDAKTGAVPELMYLALGLAGEAGEVANKVKKLFRDGDSPQKRAQLEAELGDVFWYLARLCDALGLEPEAILAQNAQKLTSRLERGVIGGEGDHR